MCGRYSLTAQADKVASEFGISEPIKLFPLDNVSPSQKAPVVRLRGGGSEPTMAVVRQSETGGSRRFDILKWELIPHWAKSSKLEYRTFNAKAETIDIKPTYREAFRKRRCIVPANGFFEWQELMKDGEVTKQKVFVSRKDGRLLGIAGLWDRWEGPDGEVIESFTIITTEPNDLMRPIHDRMPVILRSEDYESWLNSDTKPDQLKSLLVPCPLEWLSVTPVVDPTKAKTRRKPKVDDAPGLF